MVEVNRYDDEFQYSAEQNILKSQLFIQAELYNLARDFGLTKKKVD